LDLAEQAPLSFEVVPARGADDLVELDLSESRDVPDRSAQALASDLPELSPIRLGLFRSGSGRLVWFLATTLPMSRLDNLDLCYTTIGEHGVECLSNALRDDSCVLQVLIISRCKSELAEGASAVGNCRTLLAEVRPGSAILQVRTRNLTMGCGCLPADALPADTNLEELYLGGNNIGDRCVAIRLGA
jgi:hypothetical protein